MTTTITLEGPKYRRIGKIVEDVLLQTDKPGIYAVEYKWHIKKHAVENPLHVEIIAPGLAQTNRGLWALGNMDYNCYEHLLFSTSTSKGFDVFFYKIESYPTSWLKTFLKIYNDSKTKFNRRHPSLVYEAVIRDKPCIAMELLKLGDKIDSCKHVLYKITDENLRALLKMKLDIIEE